MSNEAFEDGLDENDTPENVQPEQTPDEVFAELDAVVSAAVPEGALITFRPETGFPIYIPLNEGEAGLTIDEAIIRRGLTVGPATTAYVEGRLVTRDTFVPAGTVVTLIGLVKGG